MKICDIVQFYSPHSGGVKRYIKDKIKFFSNYSNIEHVVIVPAKQDHLTTNYNTKIYNIASPPLIGSESYRLLINKTKILDIIDREKPTLIEVGDPYYSAWIAVEAGETFGCPVIGFYHSDYPRAIVNTLRRYLKIFDFTFLEKPINEYLHELYSRMNIIIVPTRKFKKVLNDIGLKNVVHIPLGYDNKIFYPRNSRDKIYNELKITKDTILLIYIGRLAREKNIKQLFKMMGVLKDYTEKKFHLLIVGAGELNRWVKRNITDFDNITWYHYCDDTERLAELYSAANLFIHAGHSETFGLVALESMACGTRVLGVKDGGLEEVLNIEKIKIFADSPDGEELAKRVIEIINLHEDENARIERSKLVEKYFLNTYTFQRLISLYDLIIKNPNDVDTIISNMELSLNYYN